MNLAVVGHVELVEFIRVAEVPRPCAIVHSLGSWEEAAGGGAVAAVQLANLNGSVHFFTGLGDDELGTRSRRELSTLKRAGEELLEIRAFHLDRATALLAELDGAAPVELQREAAEALAEAGLRAFAREANRSARQLFVRSVELEPTLRRRYLAARAADRLSDLPTVSREMEEVLAAAIAEGDGWTQGRALITLGLLILLFVAYQLWGTGIFTARAQTQLKKDFAQLEHQFGAFQ